MAHFDFAICHYGTIEFEFFVYFCAFLISMLELVQSFPHQMQDSYRLAQNFDLNSIKKDKISNIVITGMGGSGIGASIVAEYLKNNSEIPICVSKSYLPPAFISPATLFIVSSYSGNTEETVEAMRIAIEKQCQIITICSGGIVKAMSQRYDFPCQLVPSGFPPRASLAYSFYQLLHIFNQLGIGPSGLENNWLEAIKYLQNNYKSIYSDAEALAEKLANRIPVIYSDADFEAPVIRFRQQLNENSKMLAYHHVIPEMNHNELVGWKNVNKSIVALLIRTNFDYSRNQQRMDFVKRIIQKNNIEVVELNLNHENRLKNILYFVQLTDLVSVIIAQKNNIDPIEVHVIDDLKNELSKNPVS